VASDLEFVNSSYLSQVFRLRVYHAGDRQPSAVDDGFTGLKRLTPFYLNVFSRYPSHDCTLRSKIFRASLPMYGLNDAAIRRPAEHRRVRLFRRNAGTPEPGPPSPGLWVVRIRSLRKIGRTWTSGQRSLCPQPSSSTCGSSKFDGFAKSALCRSPASGRLSHVNWAHDAVSFSLLV
jgi:hypothetical protein